MLSKDADQQRPIPESADTANAQWSDQGRDRRQRVRQVLSCVHAFSELSALRWASDDHIISMALDAPENRPYRDPDVLLAYLKSAVRDDGGLLHPAG